jgi:hypothetical protein
MVRLPPYFIAENNQLSQGNAKFIGIRNNYRGFYVFKSLKTCKDLTRPLNSLKQFMHLRYLPKEILAGKHKQTSQEAVSLGFYPF